MGDGTSIGRVRGLGSARGGAHHWLLERLSGLAALIVCSWLIVSFALLPDFAFATLRQWAAQPLQLVALVLLVLALFWHTRLGLRVLIEDYVHEGANKLACLVLLELFVWGGTAIGLFFIVKIAVGAIAGAATQQALQAAMGGAR